MNIEVSFQTYQQRLMRVSAYIHNHLDDELDFEKKVHLLNDAQRQIDPETPQYPLFNDRKPRR